MIVVTVPSTARVQENNKVLHVVGREEGDNVYKVVTVIMTGGRNEIEGRP